MARRINSPSKYTEELADRVCEGLASGKGLEAVCAGDGIPNASTIYRWLEAHENFREKYARARQIQADRYFDEIVQIADDGSRDYRQDDEGRDVVDHDHIARSRLRVEARKWTASKLAPKKYGEKLELSGDADAPLTVNVVTQFKAQP